MEVSKLEVCFAALLSHSFAVSLSCYFTGSLSHCLLSSVPRCFVDSLPHCVIVLLCRCFAVSLFYCFASSLLHCFASLLHYFTSSWPWLLRREIGHVSVYRVAGDTNGLNVCQVSAYTHNRCATWKEYRLGRYIHTHQRCYLEEM